MRECPICHDDFDSEEWDHDHGCCENCADYVLEDDGDEADD